MRAKEKEKERKREGKQGRGDPLRPQGPSSDEVNSDSPKLCVLPLLCVYVSADQSGERRRKRNLELQSFSIKTSSACTETTERFSFSYPFVTLSP